MKAYNLVSEMKKMSFGDLNVIVLGERGRGRYEAFVPSPEGLKDGDRVTVSTTKSGNPKILRGGDTSGWVARISCCGCYTRNTEGHVRVHNNDTAKVKVLASGNGAEGDAGRCGNWDDLLLMVSDGTLLRVKQHGGV